MAPLEDLEGQGQAQGGEGQGAVSQARHGHENRGPQGAPEGEEGGLVKGKDPHLQEAPSQEAEPGAAPRGRPEEEGGKPQGKAPEAGEEPPSRGAHEPARPLGDEEGAEVEEGEDPDEGHLTPPGEGGPRAGPR